MGWVKTASISQQQKPAGVILDGTAVPSEHERKRAKKHDTHDHQEVYSATAFFG
jgi:hypothetical protein